MQDPDAAQRVADYAPDAILISDKSPGWANGRASIAPMLAQRLKTRGGFAITEINVATDGDFACAATLLRSAATDSLLAGTARRLDAYRKIAGHWQIVQQHVSVPVNMAAGKAMWNAPVTSRGALAWAPVAPPGPGISQAEAVSEVRHWLVVNAITPTVADAMATYGPGEDVILFDLASPTEHRGIGELTAYFTPALASVASIQANIPKFSAQANGDFGVLIAAVDLTVRMRKGASQQMSFRQSDCLRRIDGKWYSMFEMGSMPVHAGAAQ